MSKNQVDIPFTELVERVSDLARERADTFQKIRGIVNDIYTRDIPRKEDWNFLLTNSTITVTPEYTTGTVSGSTGGTTLTFGASTTLDATFTGRKIKISGNDYVYDTTFQGTTSLTIQPPLSGTSNPSSSSFSIFRPSYSLASDFDRFPKNGGLNDYSGGQKRVIPEIPYQEFADVYSASPTDRPENCRIYGVDTAGNALLELTPPPRSNKSYSYDYFIRLRSMRETTSGTIASVNAQGTTVMGDGSTQFTLANTGDYFRIDAFGTGADSEWYRIIAINGNSSLTLQTAFGLSGATQAKYTICSAPQIPAKMHPAILYGSILQITADQADPMYQAYNIKYAEVLSDGKRLYKTRIYSQDIHNLGEDYLYRQ